MKHDKVVQHITKWLKDYADNAGIDGFVIGISGGIDSALTSTLCAETGKHLIVLSMPIHQEANQESRALKHISWLKENYEKVTFHEVDLTDAFDLLEKTLPAGTNDGLTMANVRARLRMTTLYALAGHHKYLVAGTGNKVEDFGVGFFTKYGDGGVDLSPIADLMKSDVYACAKELGVIEEILRAKPTDGLWGDDRTDEDQLGASYDELEWAMEFDGDESNLEVRQKEVLKIYNRLHSANRHKMIPIPVCEIPAELK